MTSSSNSRTTVNWGNLALAALFFGAILSGVGLWGVVRAAPTSSWPSTRGVIERSRVESVGRHGPDEPGILYAYTIEERRYTGSRIGYAMFLTDGATRRLVSRYPVGAAVRVYHDPRSPDRAVLQPGGARRATLVLIAGLGLLAFWRYAGRRAAPSQGSQGGQGIA